MNTTNNQLQQNTSATSGAGMLNGTTTANDTASNLTHAQLLECLAKLDLVIANQRRLEALFASRIISGQNGAQSSMAASINV